MTVRNGGFAGPNRKNQTFVNRAATADLETFTLLVMLGK